MHRSLAVALALLVCTPAPAAQDETPPPLDFEALGPVTHRVRIDDGVFVGPGRAFLEQEARQNRYVLLGEYHGSPAISRFTDAFIPLYEAAGASYLVLEVGPHSADALAAMASSPSGARERLRDLNERYQVVTSEGRPLPPIPFFGHESDAAFLQTAVDRGWNLVGIDQEFIYGAEFLFDELWGRVPESDRPRIEPLYRAARDTLVRYQDGHLSGEYRDDPLLPPLDEGFLASETIGRYLDAAAEVHLTNAEIASHLRRSMGIYAASGWEANDLRMQHFVDFFYSGLARKGFDPEEDRVLVKMGGLHVWKGHQRLGMLDVGTAIYERARSTGDSSLHMTFLRRYRTTDSTVVDLMGHSAFDGLEPFQQAARRDEWVIIDLRPLREPLLYRRRYETTEAMRDYLLAFDLVVIPPVDVLPVPLAPEPSR